METEAGDLVEMGNKDRAAVMEDADVRVVKNGVLGLGEFKAELSVFTRPVVGVKTFDLLKGLVFDY